ncbi:MAG: pentapeptide repeat-containing protein [Coleofasciculus sp. A1-SPW-01]|uniref:pentapeptide repeat-containing protein n=1 Tax=Coleofasciculus sp. A1-SPW-01 TaxID=3070819 RepID=UPI0032F9EC21
MADKEQDLASLVAKIEQLEERQIITANYLVGVKRQLNELTDKLEDLQQRVEPQQVVEPSLTNSPTPDQGISNDITNFSDEKFKVLRITQLLGVYGDMLLLESYLAEDKSQEAPMTAQEFGRLYDNGQKDFTGINLAEANLINAYLSRVKLNEANLDGA